MGADISVSTTSSTSGTAGTGSGDIRHPVVTNYSGFWCVPSPGISVLFPVVSSVRAASGEATIVWVRPGTGSMAPGAARATLECALVLAEVILDFSPRGTPRGTVVVSG